MMRHTSLCAVFLIAFLASPTHAESASGKHDESYGNEFHEINEYAWTAEHRCSYCAQIYVIHSADDLVGRSVFETHVTCTSYPGHSLYYAELNVWFESVHLLVSAPAVHSFSADLVIPYWSAPPQSQAKIKLDSIPGLAGGTTCSTMFGDLDITLSGQAYGLASTGVSGTIDFQGWCDHEFSLPEGYEEESTGLQAGTIQSPYRNTLTLNLHTTYEDLRNTYARLVVPAWNMELAVQVRQMVGDGAFVQRILVFSFGGSTSKYLIDKRRYVKVPYPRFRSSG